MFKLPWKKDRKEKTELFSTRAKERHTEGLETLKASRLAALAIDRCGEIFNETGPRPAGSDESMKAATLLGHAFGKYADSVKLDAFRADVEGYYAPFKAVPILTLVMLLLCWIGFPSIAVILSVLCVLWIYRRFLLCEGDGGEAKVGKTLSNVHATIEPEGEVEKTIIFSSHHDSARMFTSSSLLVPLYLPVFHFAMVALVSLSLFLTEIFTGELLSFNLPPLSLGILLGLLSLSCPIQLKLFRLVGDECSPGVGDNLASGAILTELAHYFSWKKANGEGLSHTRLVFASFDGEECALKGSQRWYRENSDLLVDAIAINLDCPIRQSDLAFLTKDVNGLVPLSGELASDFAQDAASMGYEVKVGGLSLLSGATDAASAARAGIPATTLMGVPLSGSGSGIIHTPDDNLSVLDRKTVEAVLSICIKIVENRTVPVAKKEEKQLSLTDETRRFTLR